MAITLDTSWGSPTANCYVSLTEASSYFGTHFREATWTAASTANQQKSLIHATRDLDAFPWIGNRYYSDQVLEWPRTLGTDTTAEVNLSTDTEQAEMKSRVQRACCEQAYNLLAAFNSGVDDVHAEMQELGVRRWSDSVPNLSESYEYDGRGATRLCSGAWKELSRYRGSAKVIRGDNLSYSDIRR